MSTAILEPPPPATEATPAEPPPAATCSKVDRPTPLRFGVREFDRIYELGMLPQRSELVDGQIIELPPVNNPHSICRGRFTTRLVPAWPEPKFIRSQDTHRFPSGWCPMPDFALLDEEPVAGAIVDPPARLVIEISDATLEYDLGDKRLRYARAGVPEYVVADLRARTLRVFREPVADAATADTAWKQALVLAPGDQYSPLCLPDLSIDVAQVLPDVPTDQLATDTDQPAGDQ